ncbi:MAG: NAD(P)/FAD-dependent oxidoreductase, partial [Sulfurimonadaceae bacterium]|nr:NAD(P)/FAD-dependent oxidoreductase [Sulfurimonadaceae bacterium]
PSFVDFALKEFGFNRFKKFCTSMGLLIQSKDDGRCYPLSNTAGSVVTALREYARTCGVTTVCDTYISKVEKVSGCFQIHSNDQLFGSYDAVLIATGSEAAPQLGSNASGYAIAESFGHTLYPTYPSLVALELESQVHHKMTGTKQDAEVTLYINGKAEQSVRGDILFTRYGISGFAILDISQKASEALTNYQDVKIGLKLLPDYERQPLSEQISALCKSVPDYTIETVLGGLISSKIVPHILSSSKVVPETLAANMTIKMIKQLSNTLCDWRFQVNDTHGFKHAEVSGGGVATEEIDDKTMESKKVKGLYFAGEVLDIVGRRGGYNLHFAWASGYLAGTSMSRI